jgi:CBS domain-containing protein
VLVGPGAAHPVGHVDPGQGTDGPAGGPLFRGRRQRHDRAKAAGATAAELMTTPAVTIGPDAGVAEAARLLHRRGIKRLPVVDPAGPLLGIVSRSDLLIDRAGQRLGAGWEARVLM